MSYESTFPGESVTPQWLYDELTRVANEMKKAGVLSFEVLSMEPDRPQPGMVACADGSGWNPTGSATASAMGLYLRTTAGAWRRL